ncbi:hypothetical protein BHE74_00054239 [Ensete ventricosum]|nr:hypothetical protein BHE74_00054239 [Ensete ventricosum]
MYYSGGKLDQEIGLETVNKSETVIEERMGFLECAYLWRRMTVQSVDYVSILAFVPIQMPEIEGFDSPCVGFSVVRDKEEDVDSEGAMGNRVLRGGRKRMTISPPAS